MVRLQKRFAYEYKDKIHHKYVITIPEDTILKLGWKEGSELKESVKDGSLIIDFVSESLEEDRSRPKESSEPKMTYEEFCNKIKDALQYRDQGMTWTELRKYLKLEQIVPNNKWVRQLEKDIGLTRVKDIQGIVWRIRHV